MPGKLQVIEGDRRHYEANPWTPIADGFRQAMADTPPTDPRYPLIAECARIVGRLADRPLLEEVPAAVERQLVG
jgi:hypothetical protein